MAKNYKHSIVDITELKAYSNNSRTHTDEQINQVAKSISEFGFTNPVLVDANNNIIAGHCRVLAATKLLYKDVPVIILDGLTKSQQKAYVIADNQLALNAGWDMELLKFEIEDLKELNFDIDLLGFEDGYFDDESPIEADEQDIGLDYQDMITMSIQFLGEDMERMQEALDNISNDFDSCRVFIDEQI